MMQIFLDLDDVLADFDGYHERIFGWRNDRSAQPPDFWSRIRATQTFFRDLPLRPDARDLFEGVRALGLQPVILTGVPREVPEAPGQKRAWVSQHFGDDVPVICCDSKDKCRHGRLGDVLIDDYPKYRRLWEEMGGIFILHTSARESLQTLETLIASPR